MWHSEKPLENIDNIVRSIGGRPEYLFYNADKEVKRGTEQIIQASDGFIPNFASLDKNLLRDMIRMNLANASQTSRESLSVGFKLRDTQTRMDRKKYNEIYENYVKNLPLGARATLIRGVHDIDERWEKLKQKYFSKFIPEKEINNLVFQQKKIDAPKFIQTFLSNRLQELLHQHQESFVDQSPLISTSRKYNVAEGFSGVIEHPASVKTKMIGEKYFKISRILNKTSYEELTKKYGEQKVKETLLKLSELQGGKGIGFDINNILSKDRSSNEYAKEDEVAYFNSGFIPNFAIRKGIKSSDLEYVKDLGGSTGATLVRDTISKQLLVQKFGASSGHIINEARANKLYSAFGIKVPDSRLIKDKNKVFQLTEYIEGKHLNSSLNESTKDQLKERFAAISLLGDWDALGLDFDNVVVDKFGVPYQIDSGGALAYRAQGGLKGDKFGTEVGEVDTLRDPERLAGTVFGDLSDSEIRSQIKDLLANKNIIQKHGGKYRKILSKRLDNLSKFSSGFMPNFAADYVNRVMNLESNMSGNKAILDTQSGPFPFIRNSSQPNFAAAISDHGGLNNALSDSIKNQKDAGLMNKGFVPNFAGMRRQQRQRARNQPQPSATQSGFDPARLQAEINALATKALNDIRNTFLSIQAYPAYYLLDPIENGYKALKNNIQSVFAKTNSMVTASSGGFSNSVKSFYQKMVQSLPSKERLDKFTNTAMFAVPLIAAQFEQGLYGNKERTDLSVTERMGKSFLSTGLTSISTGASIGNLIFPGLGGAVGAVVGGLVAFNSSLSAATLSADELMQLNEKQTQKAQENIQSATSYIDAQKNLTDMIARGASSTEIENATKKLSENFLQIKDTKLQEEFLKAGGDLQIMTKQLQDYTNQTTKKAAFEKALIGKGSAKDIAAGYAVSLNQEQRKSLASGLMQAADIQRTIPGASIKIIENTVKDLLNSQNITPENTTEYDSIFKNAVANLYKLSLDPSKLENLAFEIEKNADVLDLSKYIQNYRNKATESVASIFQKIQDSLEQAAFVTAIEFEKKSSSQRIQSIISDFTSSLNDQISSYMMSNLPEIKKFEYANIAAKTKAEDSLVKLNDDYAAFQIQQDKEKSKFLQRNAEELTKVFKDSMLTSQENAQFFRDKVLNQLQSGKYNEINVGNVAKEIQSERTKQFNDLIKSNTLGLPATLDLTKSQDVEGFRNATKAAMEAKVAMAPEEERQKIVNEFTLILDALNNALKASEFAKNQFAKDDIARAIAERERNKTSLELEQQNAEKELQIKQDLNRLKIAAELQYSVESNRIQKENFTRIKEAEITAKNLGFAIDIAKANSESYIAALRRGLEDPRQEYGMGVRESLERRIGIENKVLEEQRRMEDQNLATEMAQAQLQLAAEIQNTNALEKLTQVMNQWITDRLAEDLGGQSEINKIQEAYAYNANPENIDSRFGLGTARKYQAYLAAQKNQSSLGSAGALGANAPVLDFTQLSELAKGNPVLESQVELLKKQYETREKILGIQRQTVDEDIRIKQENERLNTTIMGRLEKGFGNMAKQSDQIILDLAERAPSAFADGMTNALMEVAKGTKSIGDALQDMVINFGQMLMQEVMRAAMYRAIGSIGSGLFQNGGIVGKQRGGIIRAENGTYIPGNRTGDRNLALLEDGEYVLNREAVAAIGVNNLDGLNYGVAPRFQSGGGFGFAAQQSLIEDELNYSGNLIGSGMDTRPVSLDDYSAYAFENDPFFKNMRQKSIETEKERVNKEFQAKQKRAQLISSVVGAVGSIALAQGLSSLGSAGGGGKSPVAGKNTMSGKPQSLKTFGQTGGLVSNLGIGRYQSGGFIPYGSRISDNVPRYMSGGMNAISNAANNKYISANSSRIQGGGSNSTTNNTNNTNNSNINIVANVGSYNKSGQFVLGQSGNNYDSNEMIFSQNLARNIAKVADNQIQKANRYGGFNKQSYV
jgi:hypothetical protein